MVAVLVLARAVLCPFFLPSVLLPTSRANLPPRIFRDVTSISIMTYQKAHHSKINNRVGLDRLKASVVRDLSPGHCKTWLPWSASQFHIGKSIHSHYGFIDIETPTWTINASIFQTWLNMADVLQCPETF